MSRSVGHVAGLLAVTVLFAAGAANAPARAQKPVDKITIKFKLFDTNVPSKVLKPTLKANVFVRDPVTKRPTFLDAEDVKPVGNDFYEVKVSKGWLIEQLVIDVDDPVKDYNPAFVTKVVSAADMTLYPGASKARDEFSFQAYIAQLSAYRALLAQLLDEAINQKEKDGRRALLRAIFKGRLLNMADINKRLLNPKKAEFSSAFKLLNEVLKLYGLPYSDEPERVACCEEEMTSAGAIATIVVTIPSNAKLFVDGAATTSSGSRRILTTPSLPAGKDFVYTLRQRNTRNGKTEVDQAHISVRAGHVTRVYFQDPSAAYEDEE